MAVAIVEGFRPPIGTKHPVESIEWVPSGGGVFTIEVDGELIFSKKEAGRHAEVGEILEALRKRL